MGEVATRDENGRFLPGVSGNPAGRTKGSKNHIVELRQQLEIAVREGVKSEDISEIIEVMVNEAKAGNEKAAKMILDKFLPTPKDAEDADDGGHTYVFKIENATMALGAKPDEETADPIEAGFHVEEASPNQPRD